MILLHASPTPFTAEDGLIIIGFMAVMIIAGLLIERREKRRSAAYWAMWHEQRDRDRNNQQAA